MHDAGLTQEAYLQVIRSKTAKLFEASCRLAAVLAGSPPAIEDACAEYGCSLGTAFQIIDDVLDYDGDAHEMGKSLGDDLREGKATLPLILAMERGSPDEAVLVRAAIETGEAQAEALARIVAIVRRCGALEGARAIASDQAGQAMAAARALPDNPYARALLELAAELLQRRA
ncbi:MAG: polyprenyl synthetase family protein, partial [Burkholderiaceae bacterium]|jgi:octaprenyl-diphosphate synthase|nr:polyprenyl synthetase family protein [Burkholderiaceae bacterium]